MRENFFLINFHMFKPKWKIEKLHLMIEHSFKNDCSLTGK